MQHESRKHIILTGLVAVVGAVALLILSGIIPAIIEFLLKYLLVYRYSMLFAIVFFSAIIVPIPANTVLLAVGAFIGQGYFDFHKVILVSLVSNVVGDVVGYSITYIYGHSIARKMGLRQHSYFARLRSYVKSHPFSTVFLTRFITSLGSLVNFIAGLAPIPFATFIIYDIIGNLANIFLFLYLGYYVGNHWERFSDIFSWVGGVVGILIVAVVFVKTISKKES